MANLITEFSRISTWKVHSEQALRKSPKIACLQTAYREKKQHFGKVFFNSFYLIGPFNEFCQTIRDKTEIAELSALGESFARTSVLSSPGDNHEFFFVFDTWLSTHNISTLCIDTNDSSMFCARTRADNVNFTVLATRNTCAVKTLRSHTHG